MRTKILAALSVTTLVLSACGGEAPPPDAPAPPPPPPAPMASAAPAPTDTTPPAPPPKPALADVIPQTLQSVSAAFNAHDAQKMSGFATDDCAAYTYGAGETHSRGDMANGVGMLFTSVPDVTSANTRVWIKGNVAIVEEVWAGTMKGDMGPFKATNKPVGGTLLSVNIFTDDGLVKEIHEYGNDAALMAQMLGKKDAPPAPTLPTNPPEVHTGKGTPDEDNLVTWAKGLDDTFNKGDFKAAAATWSDDGDLLSNLGGPATKGKKDMLKDVQGWFKAFPDQKWAATNAWGIDGFAIVEHTMTGTHKGPLGKLAATGKPVTGWHWVDIFQPTADGKVQHDWAYANMNELLAQVGALKMPGDKKAGGAKKP
jgi:ketosteroid isomerase-like protein